MTQGAEAVGARDHARARPPLEPPTLREKLAQRAHSGKNRAEGAGGGEKLGLPLPELDAISGETCDTTPQSLPEKLEASVADAMDLHWSLVRAGKRLMRVVERENTFRELRRPGAMQVLISARMSADKLMDSQLRVDEAKLRAATSENVVAKILERLEARDPEWRTKLADHDRAVK